MKVMTLWLRVITLNIYFIHWDYDFMVSRKIIFDTFQKLYFFSDSFSWLIAMTCCQNVSGLSLLSLAGTRALIVKILQFYFDISAHRHCSLSWHLLRTGEILHFVRAPVFVTKYQMHNCISLYDVSRWNPGDHIIAPK